MSVDLSILEKVSFNEHIQPILSANCYHCHGPDMGTRLPEDEPYRLDTEEGAFQVRKNGKANIIKGDPDKSYLIELMESKDKDLVMPLDPSRSAHGKVMDPADIAMVRRWVKEGAVFEDHWAYISPKKANFPSVKQRDWVKQPIDNFILSKMERNGFKPNVQEEKYRLLRRLTLDLTGLAPTVEDLKTFVEDKRDFDVVYEEKVNSLLQSEAYAEHFARHWLDVARYGDTHGIHMDNYRSIWPYRDWVIDAFSKNMPFDQFTYEQVAGDLIPNATIDQKVATGFFRCASSTGEGGTIPAEVKATYVQEQASTTGAVWLGLTVGCAACHDHKFDAISTKENYQLTAFFRNTTMQPLDGNKSNHPPFIHAPTIESKRRLAEVEKELVVLQAKNNAHKKAHAEKNEAEFQTWLKQPVSNTATYGHAAEGVLINLPLNSQEKGIGNPAYKSIKPLLWSQGVSGNSAKLTDNNLIDLGATSGEGEFNEPFSYGAWVKLPVGGTGGIIAKMEKPPKYKGYDLYLAGGKLMAHFINDYPKNALVVATTAAVKHNVWMHVFVTYDGSHTPEGVKIYVNGVSQPISASINALTGSLKTPVPLQIGARSEGLFVNNLEIQHMQFYNRQVTPAEVLQVSTSNKEDIMRELVLKDPKQIEKAREFYFSVIDTTTSALQADLARLSAEREKLSTGGTVSLVMQENSKQMPSAHVLIRGQYTDLGEKVEAGTPASLPPMKKDAPKNRLGLAMWLTDPANPLPARVTVNRYWYYFFGTGIVESNSDFGVMGARPTHPKALDWLAKDFVDNDWDFHHLLKQIVLSATYRQSSSASANKLEKDPKNLLYARGPRYRMDAEQIRDLALMSSSLLHQHIGGPSVKPYQPINIWEAVAMKQSDTRYYKPDSGDKLYRRSMYTFWKRTAHHPAMAILNAPSREESCVKRELTNTPLQALVIMNDPQFVEAARVLATHAIRHGETSEARIDFMTTRLLSREMTTDEKGIITRALDLIKAEYKAVPEDATKLITVGATKPDPELDPEELASWTVIASQIMNLDETLNK